MVGTTMATPRNEFTDVTALRAEALGEPGKRMFRILADSGSSSAIMWLEKEQLFQLALAIQQLLATPPEDQQTYGSPPTSREAQAMTRLDFPVGKLVLGYDGGKGLFIIEAHEPVEDEEAEAEELPAIVRVWANRQQVKQFSEEALQVCAAGRPLCPLCGSPMETGGHQCPRHNGHPKIASP
jgi:uncharacterized repeat protein (TIGR03847 family)